MTKKPKILITNDDGVYAPGIKHLWESLVDIADVTVVAPAVEQSAVGLSITIRDPLRVEPIRWKNASEVFSVNGTPADCVKLALNVILNSPPDLIVSGINRGNNSGRNVLYSGTVAGVIEGTIHDIPGIAFSCMDFHNPKYTEAKKHIPKIVTHFLNNPLPTGTFLNVNFPDKEFKGYKMARQGKEYWAENPDRREHPAEGKAYYWLGAKLKTFKEHEESDIELLKQGFITAVPLKISELTDHSQLIERKQSFESLF